jgi:HprK-related kinase A
VTATNAPRRALQETPLSDVQSALAGNGLFLDVGLATMRVRSQVPSLAPALHSVYRHFEFQTAAPWTDLHVDVVPGQGLRRWLWPQAIFRSDSEQPFEPFPADTALPLMEWGANFLIGRRFNNLLLLHAGVVEKDGFCLVMPALPGSGKSTLTAALSLSGWRLLSDEFGALDLQRGSFRPALKPAALKNDSIQVIRNFAPHAELGPEFPRTRKGKVAHLAPSRQAVLTRHEHAWPGAVVLPRWQAGHATELTPIQPQMAFSALAFNAFNYATLGAAGFKAAVAVAGSCPTWQLIYSDLDDALARLAREWPTVVEQGRERLLQTAPVAGGATS